MKLGYVLPTFDDGVDWLDAKPSPADAQDAVTLVHFWSSRCPLCHEGAHEIARWRRRFGDRLRVIAFYQPRPDESASAADVRHDARDHMAIDYPCAFDESGEVARRFDSEFAPSYFLFDRSGRLRHRQMGNAELASVAALIERLSVKAS
jgi:hypothetical protein